jgi:hypothetical protein
MGLREFLEYQEMLSLDDRKNIVLISITEPDDIVQRVSEYNPIATIGFHDVLETRSEIDDYERYDYNPTVFDKIMKG